MASARAGRRRQEPRARSTKPAGARAWAPAVLTILLIWLAWQVVVSLLVQRAPVEVAIRLAPSSAQVLSRAAESELVAGRFDQAGELARLALRAGPFDARALRVLGLVTARSNPDAADPLLTLAGNWSLRDDPAHAWLIDRRLRQGDYAGAFGHADALARRREDLHPRLFELFTVAAVSDPRATPHLLARLAARPNWRGYYLETLHAGDPGAQVQAVIAQGLERTKGKLTDGELQNIYTSWVTKGRIPGLRELRRRLNRPPPAPLRDGGFDAPPGPRPFRWTIETGPGLHADISERPDQKQPGLFIETDGFSTRRAAGQLMLLDPGSYRLAGEYWFEAGGLDPRMDWAIRCVETDRVIAVWAPKAAGEDAGWARGFVDFAVPDDRCTAQWLELWTRRGSRRSSIVAWFDDLSVAPSISVAPNG